MDYRSKEEFRLLLNLNKKGSQHYYFSRDRLYSLSGLCQVYLEEYPDLKEIDLTNPTFNGDELCLFFRFMDTLSLPESKEECLGLYRVATYFCLVERYMKILRDDMTKYFLEKFGFVLTFDDRGGYSYQGALDHMANLVARSFGLPQGIMCNPGPQGMPGSTGEDTAKKTKKWRAQKRAARNKK